ncbi:MAG: class IV adenylate cyclase [archaeon]
MEIEIKAKLDNKEEILKKLKELGWEAGEEIEENDIYHVSKDVIGRVRGPGDFILRVRSSSKGNFLTFKAFTDTRGVWEEYETEISDVESIRKILLKAGFVEDMVINKKRIKGKIDDMEVCIDDLNIIGPHIECELISDDKESAIERLSNFLKSLGITEDNFERRGYGEIFGEMKGIKFNQ